MESKVFILGLIFALQHLTMAGSIAPSQPASRNLFAADLLSVIVNGKSSENIVYSPASIQTCLALAFAGAEGETANEMRKVLKFGQSDKTEIFKNYGEFLKSSFKSTTRNGPKLKMANRLYVSDDLKVSKQFNKIAKDNFGTRTVNVDFKNSKSTIEKINNWVERQTQHKIKNFLQPDAVDAATNAVLVNAIYFKGKWAKPFPKAGIKKADFHINSKQRVQVDFMRINDHFHYADLPELDATALEIPYKNSDLSMLIILPNEVEGLQNLESKLQGMDLNNITSEMWMSEVDVFLPKFRIEFDIDLEEPLKKMGLSSMFSSYANFSSLFDSDVHNQISAVKHKAFLDVNEGGSEAAAATYMVNLYMSAREIFDADRPLVFAIRSKTAVYFAGHVAKF